MVIVDAHLVGGASDRYAIEGAFTDQDSVSMYLRGVTTEGYKKALHYSMKNWDYTADGADLTEYIYPEPVYANDKTPKRFLRLGVRYPPEREWGDPSTWSRITGRSQLQSFFDSDKMTGYIPASVGNFRNPTTYFKSSGYKHLLCFNTIDMGTIVNESGDEQSVLNVDAFRGRIDHKSKGNVIIKYGFPQLNTQSGCGDVFIADWCCDKLNVQNCNVWAWSFNEETKTGYKIENNGGNLVVFGLKTEFVNTVLYNHNSASTEILGGIMFPVQDPDPSGPMFINDNSNFSVLSRYLRESGKDYSPIVKEVRDGNTTNYKYTEQIPKNEYVCYASNASGVGDVEVGAPPTLASISIRPASVILGTLKTAQFSATAYDQYGS